jgi:hypothetical protein
MPFVVKVSGAGSLSPLWLTPDSSNGSYAFEPRKDALVFPALADAIDAVDTATKAFGQLGMAFSVQIAD